MIVRELNKNCLELLKLSFNDINQPDYPLLDNFFSLIYETILLSPISKR